MSYILLTDGRTDGHTDRQSDYCGHPFRVSGFFPSTYHQGSAQHPRLTIEVHDKQQTGPVSNKQLVSMCGEGIRPEQTFRHELSPATTTVYLSSVDTRLGACTSIL